MVLIELVGLSGSGKTTLHRQLAGDDFTSLEKAAWSELVRNLDYSNFLIVASRCLPAYISKRFPGHKLIKFVLPSIDTWQEKYNDFFNYVKTYISTLSITPKQKAYYYRRVHNLIALHYLAEKADLTKPVLTDEHLTQLALALLSYSTEDAAAACIRTYTKLQPASSLILVKNTTARESLQRTHLGSALPTASILKQKKVSYTNLQNLLRHTEVASMQIPDTLQEHRSSLIFAVDTKLSEITNHSNQLS